MVGTHLNRLAEAVLMSTHNKCFYGELTQMILHLLSNTLFICFSVTRVVHTYRLQLSALQFWLERTRFELVFQIIFFL